MKTKWFAGTPVEVELVVCCYRQRSGLQSTGDLQTKWSAATAR